MVGVEGLLSLECSKSKNGNDIRITVARQSSDDVEFLGTERYQEEVIHSALRDAWQLAQRAADVSSRVTVRCSILFSNCE